MTTAPPETKLEKTPALKAAESPELTYQVEDWFLCKDDMAWLWPLHWEEVAGDKDKIKLNVWFDAYDNLARTGQLFIVTMRDAEKKVVGYFWSVIRPHLHYQDSLTSYTDIYFVHPLYRKGINGVKLFRVAEDNLRALGVQKMYIGTKVKLDMSRIFEYLGWHESEKVYTKYIGD